MEIFEKQLSFNESQSYLSIKYPAHLHFAFISSKTSSYFEHEQENLQFRNSNRKTSLEKGLVCNESISIISKSYF